MVNHKIAVNVAKQAIKDGVTDFDCFENDDEYEKLVNACRWHPTI